MKPHSAACGTRATVESYAIQRPSDDRRACAEDVDAACRALRAEFSNAVAEEGDGMRLDWDRQWVQVRASNTEPIIRIIAEAPDETAARGLCCRAMAVDQKAVN